MLLRGLVLSLLLFFLPLGFGHIPKYQRRERRHSRPHVLHPTVHPDVDRTDPKHIRANEGLTLHYHDPHAAFPEIRSFASVHVSGFRHPAVLLEHSIYVASTQCETDPSTITVAFKHRPAWEMALKDWQQHPKFMLVAFEDSCGLGRESGERSVHLVHNITAISNTLEIIGHMSELSLTDAIHPDREVAIDVDTYDVHNTSAPFAPSHLTRRDNGDTTAGGDDSDSSLGKSSSGSSTSKWPSPDSTSSTATDQPTARPDSIAPVNNGEMANGSDIDARPESGNGDGNAQPSSPHSIPDTNGTSPPPDFTNETNEDSVSNFDLYGFNHAGNLWNVPPATEENEDAAVMELIQQQHAKDDIDGYWTMDELLGADAQHTLLPEAIDSGSDNSLSTRIGGDCGSAFDPVSLLIDCVALPLAKLILPEPIYSILKGLFSLFDVNKLYNFFKDIVELVVAVLSDKGYTPSGEVTFDTNTSVLPLENTSEFGWAYKIASLHPTEVSAGGKSSVLGSLSVFCVGCRINGFLKYRSKFKFTVSNFKFTSAEVELVDGQLDFAAGVGVIFSLTYKDKIAERNIFEIGLSPLQIPGIIVLGPMLTMDTGVGYEVGGEGKFLARTNFGWSNMTAKLDMVGDTSYLGEWVPIVPRPLVSAELKGKATLDPYISAGLLFGVSILKGKFKARTGVEVRASLPVTASVAVSGSSDNDVTLNGDCRGITIELAAKLEIYLTVDITKYNRHYGIQDITVPVFSHCIPIPTAMQMDKLAPDVLPPIYIPANNHTKYVSITAEIGRRGIMQIIWLPWPIDTIAIVPPVGANVSAQAILSRLFLSSTTVPDTNGTVGAYDGRLLHFNGNDMAAFGVARLQLSRPDSISKSSVLVAFRSERGKNGKPAFVGGVTTASTTKLSTYYYPIVCLYSPGHYSGQKFQPATLFLATDPKAAPKAITDQNVVDKLNYPYQYPDINLLGGPRVEYCQFAPFTITQT